ncbi:huntingtin-associated protein 1, partial [Tachyglossus aculeatus]|uniref:huntingtin-associated protein 1 n=1 Tax=Tachyglossus aculeatus TaxID=9261 RepID=UPI0018F5D438
THGHQLQTLITATLDSKNLCEGRSGPTLDIPALSGAAASALQDATTITELCANLPEVEIISLLEEQLPRYTLRADSVFGYGHGDWLQTPLLPAGAAERLTPIQVRETLHYFLLCSERVGRITQTYRDIDAVTSLLEEKERDLELAACIGQSLLKQNSSLTERNELLEEQLEQAKEEIAQLRHEVAMRDDLLHLYTNTTEDSEPPSATATPLRRNDSSVSLQHSVQLDVLQQKLRGLEEENRQLRLEATSIATETSQYEDQEQQLMLDCVEQFSEASHQVTVLSEELSRRVEEQARQQEEISQLLGQIVGLQSRCRAFGTERDELQQHLAASREVQQQLRTELQDLQEKYAECRAMLSEAREELRNQRNRDLPSSTVSHYSNLHALPLDSLAAEIKGTMRKRSGSQLSEHGTLRRAFETVKAVNQGRRASSVPGTPQHLPGSLQRSQPGTPHSVLDPVSDASGEPPNETSPEEEVAGVPGDEALEQVLRQLEAWQVTQGTERVPRMPNRDGDGFTGLPGNDCYELPGSGLSLGSLVYLPEKLQIVKPLEGSVTLHHWQQLAQPHLAGILDPRPGVLTKDFRRLEVDAEEVYNLQDLEEDEVDAVVKGRSPVLHPNNLPQTPATHTITTCRLARPTSSDVTSVTHSLCHTVVPCCGPSEKLNHVPTSTPSLLLPPPTLPPPSCLAEPASPAFCHLLPILTQRGISAATPPDPPAPAWTVRPTGSFGLAQALLRDVRDTGEGHGDPRGFSLNLVRKLRQLGLDRVVARGTGVGQGETPEPPGTGP